MTVTVLKLSDADTYLKNISIKNIKDGGEWIEVSAGLNTVVVPGLKTGSTDGLRKVRVKQTDAAGNETVSSELSFTLDTIDPVFTTDIRLQQDTGISGIDGITSNGRIIVPAPEAGASWSYRIDNGSFQNGGSSNSFEVPEGRHNVTVRMTDVAGNNAEQTKTVTVDTVSSTPAHASRAGALAAPIIATEKGRRPMYVPNNRRRPQFLAARQRRPPHAGGTPLRPARGPRLAEPAGTCGNQACPPLAGAAGSRHRPAPAHR